MNVRDLISSGREIKVSEETQSLTWTCGCPTVSAVCAEYYVGSSSQRSTLRRRGEEICRTSSCSLDPQDVLLRLGLD